MLFPLNLEIDSDFDKANSSRVEDIVKTDPQQFVDDSDGESLEEQLAYQGPMTQSHTKTLIKVNLVLIAYSDIYNTFQLKNI